MKTVSYICTENFIEKREKEKKMKKKREKKKITFLSTRPTNDYTFLLNEVMSIN